MNTPEFETSLTADGFGEITTVERQAGYQLGEHAHPFDALALITAGQITLLVDGVSTTYGVGDIFRLAAGTPHHESAGPQGVAYRVGRRAVCTP
ncbi:MAG: cupin domain-containing protein [Polaromonas sp.]|uniref:cupin domain-containing protein n=1 Tax=Polaromonas sp. TaxID=1869339 RepID=UPI004037262C